jgi:cellulose synthase/poly-beta-1,6-N-acetylglucosamine synthase-like glycosyltransferase
VEAICIWLAVLSTFFWAGFAVLPWGVWPNREVLEVTPVDETLTEVTVVIPARNEAEVIQWTLLSVAAQGTDFNIILIDDASDDGTVAVARQLAHSNLRINESAPLPRRLERQALGAGTSLAASYPTPSGIGNSIDS